MMEGLPSPGFDIEPHRPSFVKDDETAFKFSAPTTAGR
jgi:hypothetical protein